MAGVHLGGHLFRVDRSRSETAVRSQKPGGTVRGTVLNVREVTRVTIADASTGMRAQQPINAIFEVRAAIPALIEARGNRGP